MELLDMLVREMDRIGREKGREVVEVEKLVEVPVVVEKLVEVQKVVEKPVYIEKIIEQPVYIEKIM
jgi:hypothetical protein